MTVPQILHISTNVMGMKWAIMVMRLTGVAQDPMQGRCQSYPSLSKCYQFSPWLNEASHELRRHAFHLRSPEIEHWSPAQKTDAITIRPSGVDYNCSEIFDILPSTWICNFFFQIQRNNKCSLEVHHSQGIRAGGIRLMSTFWHKIHCGF